MKVYQRLSQAERYQICILRKSDFSVRAIARRLNREPSTISREINKNALYGKRYEPVRAQIRARQRRSGIHPPLRIHRELGVEIYRLIGLQWSPEQISGRLRLEGITISHETIYRFLYKRPWALYRNLRLGRKYRRSRASSARYKNKKKNFQTWIDDRPDIVDRRERIGDFERDTVFGKKDGPILLTIVDRTSKLTKIAKIKGVNAFEAHNETVRLLRNEVIHTITNDNGSEFASHKLTSAELNTPIYFNRPYCAWQRGTNENTNGLIRQYYPKGFDFNAVSDQDLHQVENLLNTRPRKRLGFKTPIEVHTAFTRVLR